MEGAANKFRDEDDLCKKLITLKPKRAIKINHEEITAKGHSVTDIYTFSALSSTGHKFYKIGKCNGVTCYKADLKWFIPSSENKKVFR